MRFAEAHRRAQRGTPALAAAVAAASLALSGCAMFSSSPKGDNPPLPPLTANAPAASKAPPAGTASSAPAAGTAQAAAAAPATTPATTPALPAKVEPPPVDPAVERAFANARAALLANRMDEAERGFTALAKTNPELGGVHANLGIVYRRAGKFPESVAALERAVAANPKQPVYLNQLGIAYRMAGQFERAKETYEKAIDADPNYALAYLNLGILFDVYLWDSARALELYDRYLSMSPSGDDKVRKWASDIRNRNPKKLASRKEQG